MNDWKKTAERENKKRSLCIDQAKLIAIHMDGTWHVDTRHFKRYPTANYVSINCTELNVSISINWGIYNLKGMKVEASAYVFGQHYQKIGFSIDRSAQVLAKDIQNRLISSIDVFRDSLVEKQINEKHKNELMKFRLEAFKKVVPIKLDLEQNRPSYYGGIYGRKYLRSTPSREPSVFPSIYLDLNYSEKAVNIFLGKINETLAFKIIELVKQEYNSGVDNVSI